MRTNVTVTALMMTLLAPAGVWAHPQSASATFLAGLSHPFTGLDHLLAMIMVGVWAAQMGARAIWAVPAAFITAVLAGGALGFAGFDIPAVEPLLAATVLFLGLLILSGSRTSVALGVALSALFAMFHGVAHAVDRGAPTVEVLVYAMGLVAATILLHAIGILGALAARGRVLVLRLAAASGALAGALMLASRIG